MERESITSPLPSSLPILTGEDRIMNFSGAERN
jgi:hypothetical protein